MKIRKAFKDQNISDNGRGSCMICFKNFPGKVKCTCIFRKQLLHSIEVSLSIINTSSTSKHVCPRAGNSVTS